MHPGVHVEPYRAVRPVVPPVPDVEDEYGARLCDPVALVPHGVELLQVLLVPALPDLPDVAVVL